MSLTEKRQEFVRHYRKLLRKHQIAKEAFLAAGYSHSETSIRVQVHCLVHNPEVIAAIYSPHCVGKSICQHCNGEFSQTHSTRKFCSMACRNASQEGRRKMKAFPRRCLHCQAEFLATREQLYCSRECRNVKNLERFREKTRLQGYDPQKMAAWKARSREQRGKERAAYRAIKELGIEI